MFHSYEYICLNKKTRQFKLEIKDSDFATTIFVNETLANFLAINVSIAQEYARRNLPVAKNMALLCLYLEERGHKMYNIIYHQDHYCPEHIENWVEIAAERDRILAKLSAMK